MTTVTVDLSEDPGPHAVFFSCVRRAGRGGGIQGVVVVVVVGLGGTLECGGETLEWEGGPLEWDGEPPRMGGGPLEWDGESPRMGGDPPRIGG